MCCSRRRSAHGKAVPTADIPNAGFFAIAKSSSNRGDRVECQARASFSRNTLRIPVVANPPVHPSGSYRVSNMMGWTARAKGIEELCEPRKASHLKERLQSKFRDGKIRHSLCSSRSTKYSLPSLYFSKRTLYRRMANGPLRSRYLSIFCISGSAVVSAK